MPRKKQQQQQEHFMQMYVGLLGAWQRSPYLTVEIINISGKRERERKWKVESVTSGCRVCGTHISQKCQTGNTTRRHFVKFITKQPPWTASEWLGQFVQCFLMLSSSGIIRHHSVLPSGCLTSWPSA